MSIPQIFTRQPRSVGLFDAQPKFAAVEGFAVPQDCVETRCAAYPASGSYFIYSQPGFLQLVEPVSGQNLFQIPLVNVTEMSVSPSGTYVAAWCPVAKNEDGSFVENAKIIKIDLANKSHSIVRSFVNKSQSGWIPQYTSDESMMALMASPFVIDFYRLEDIKIQCTLNFKDTGKVESFQLSPGKNPSVAVFIASQKSNPAFIRVYSLPNVKTPVSQKSFFKGESCVFHWNALGTSLLALVSTEVDSSNRSYYGETQLYLLGISGSFDQKINLNKEGPIHEVAWSPTSREFAVIHGYMPASTSFFDARGNHIHSLDPASRNTIIYSPHGKYILVAGFGNLPGEVDILDRQDKFKRVAHFQASNTSVCKWSPDGRYILTATTSPRLRVDNGFKIWYVNGDLVYQSQYDVLNSVDWRFQPLSDFPPLGAIGKPVEVHPSAVEFMAKQAELKSKAASTGAYVPPWARKAGAKASGRSLSELDAQKNGTAKFVPNVRPQRVIPGYNPIAPTAEETKPKTRKKKTKAEGETESTGSSPQPAAEAGASGVIGGVVSLEEKKMRNLLKKLRAIEVLKLKQANGESLELTQISKIATEEKVREELTALGWKDE